MFEEAAQKGEPLGPATTAAFNTAPFFQCAGRCGLHEGSG
jgi:hypothetical protein